MLHLNLLDANYRSQTSVVPDKDPRLVMWDRTCKQNAPLVVTDWAIDRTDDGWSGVYLWLLESPEARAGQFSRSKLLQLEHRFDGIFTSDRRLVEATPEKYRYAPVGGIWVEEPGIRVKSKSASMIASSKTETPAQRGRAELAGRLGDRVDVFGRGREREIARVEEALDDYMFSIAVENATVAGYWTEKLLNCFATGTVPVYRGAPDIGRYFDERGILPLEGAPLDLSLSHYRSLLPYVVANYHEALRYEIPDDRLVVDHFSDWL